jgi:hypothetical protein
MKYLKKFFESSLYDSMSEEELLHKFKWLKIEKEELEEELKSVTEAIKKKREPKPEDYDNFWEFVKKADWQSDHDYERIEKYITDNYNEIQQGKMRQIFNKLSSDLHNRFQEDWLGDPGIEVSDDGWSDLRAEVIGRGKEFYDNITVEKLQQMAIDNDYHESFAYSFPY